MSKPDQRLNNDKLWGLLDKLRGIDFHRLEELAEFLKKENVQFSADDLIIFGHFLATQLGRSYGTFHVPDWLISVFSALIEGISPKIICDPWAGIGLLVGNLREKSLSKEAAAFTKNHGEYALGRELVPEANWQVGDPLSLLDAVTQELDVVASILPMGAKSVTPLRVTLPNGNTIELRDDLGNLVLVAASLRLSASGVGLFVVTPSFFFSLRSVFRQFDDLGLSVEAALALPSGAFAPYTNIPAYLVIIRRKVATQMFVAQLSSNSKTNLQIISNFHHAMAGDSLDLGRFVAPQSFKGLDAIRTAEKLELAEKRFGAQTVKLEELATTINLGRFGDDFIFQPLENAIYIPLIGSGDVVESIDDLVLKKQNYTQVVIDPTRSNARFVASFLNSEIGKELREQSKSGTVIPKLNKQTLKELQVFVPDLLAQMKTLEIEAKIATENNTVLALKNELVELRRDLWAKAVPNVEHRLSSLSQRLAGEIKHHTAENLHQWIETLPFPLASILRVWQATLSHDFERRHRYLLHFFEATAEFLVIILLSAFSSNEAVFEPHKRKMQEQKLNYKRPTFGTWKKALEYLGEQVRELLSENGKKLDVAKNDRALCAEMFSDPSLSLPQFLSQKDLATVFSTPLTMRNDLAHGSGLTPQEAQHRNELLLAELQKLREVMADTWAEMQLVRGINSRNRHGVIEHDIALLMGSNSQFLKEKRSMAISLDVECLYVLKKDSNKALKLLPLVRLEQSPQATNGACYFFNRLESDGAKFVSYHFSAEPSFVDQFDDAIGAIKSLIQR